MIVAEREECGAKGRRPGFALSSVTLARSRYPVRMRTACVGLLWKQVQFSRSNIHRSYLLVLVQGPGADGKSSIARIRSSSPNV